MTASDDFLQKYGPVALITGASAGIGRSFAGVLAARGFNLVLAARRGTELAALARQLEAEHGVQVTVCQIDLTDPAAVGKILAETDGQDIGLVVSNAGYGFRGDHASLDPAALTGMLMVNCLAPMLLANGFTPRLRARGRGGIILTSSVEALIGMPHSLAYAASKGFVNRLGEGLWAELTPDNIDVLTICPGATATDALRRAGMDPATLHNVQEPDEVARLSLENITNGPVYLPNAHYAAMMQHLTAMPIREALSSMASAMIKK